MSIALYRIDDRLIHGQVAVGWGQPLGLRFIVLVDDDVAGSEWEQELYRMGVPPDMNVRFLTVADAAARLESLEMEDASGMVLAPDIGTMRRLIQLSAGRIQSVNVGGVHHVPGRVGRLRYVYLTADEEQILRDMAEQGVQVTAQDVPSARPVPLAELLASRTGT